MNTISNFNANNTLMNSDFEDNKKFNEKPKFFFDNEMERKIEQFSKSKLPVLITGPSGSGKSTLARKIHEKSDRKNGPFVVVNLAEIHEATIESELFGHERGAFTGANFKKKGLLECADGGTVFLDEVSELTLKYQARLLEFLQSMLIRPVGAVVSKKLNVRIICATHRDLDLMVKNQQFREDLLYRVRVLGIELLGIKDPAIDFNDLIHDMIEKSAKKEGKIITSLEEKLAETFELYSWPGNFRELEHLIEACVVVATSDILKYSDLPTWFIKKISENKVFSEDFNLTKLVKDYLQLNIQKADLQLEHEKVLLALECGYVEWATHFSKNNKISLQDLTGLSATTLWRLKGRVQKYLKNPVF